MDSLQPTLLVVDDTPDNLAVVADLLRPLYRVKVANSGQRALHVAAADPQPDLILLDVMIPEMDGHEVCRRLKADARTRDIPVIFLTALDAEADEAFGLSLGAVDYITKPISPPLVMARVKAQLRLKEAADFLRDKSAFLEAEVQRRTREIETVQDVTIEMMSSLAETRDNETGHHIRRTQHYVLCLARHLAQDPRYAPELNDESIRLMFKSAPLHDIGKIGIPDAILLKPGRLDDAEMAVMRTHAQLGKEAIERAERQIGADVAFLRYAKEIAWCHHEKWDGSGYPRKLAGEAIPLSARLMALADVYDALINRRVYKRAYAEDEVLGILRDGRGSHFDPAVVDAFFARLDDFRAIAARFADPPPD